MTEFGQSVFVRGDVNDPGQWGDLSDGLQLFTEPSTYPTWTSTSTSTISSLVGQSFEYKLVVQIPGGNDVRWEAGDNRRGFAQPSVLQATDAHHRGAWQ